MAKTPKREVHPLMSQKEARELLMTGEPDEIYERLRWDAPICAEELRVWYQRFCVYRDLPASKRTLLEARVQFEMDRPSEDADNANSVAGWYRASVLYLWGERIHARNIFFDSESQEVFKERSKEQFERQFQILEKLQARSIQLLDSGIVLDNQNAVTIAATLKAFQALHGVPERKSKASEKEVKAIEQAPQIIVNMPPVIATPRIQDKVIDISEEK